MEIVNMFLAVMGLCFSIVSIRNVCLINTNGLSILDDERRLTDKWSKIVLNINGCMNIFLVSVLLLILLGDGFSNKSVDIATISIIGCMLMSVSSVKYIKESISLTDKMKGTLFCYKITDILVSVTLVLCMLQYIM